MQSRDVEKWTCTYQCVVARARRGFLKHKNSYQQVRATGATCDACNVSCRARQNVTCFCSCNKLRDCIALHSIVSCCVGLVHCVKLFGAQSLVRWCSTVCGKTAGVLVGRWKGKVGLVCIQVPEEGASGGSPAPL
jgi:hypothetical protein